MSTGLRTGAGVDSTDEQGMGSVNGRNSGVPTALSANQIIELFQEQPDALVEIKSQIAEMPQQQSAPIQEDSITDEALYTRIASDPQLRASITTFLRARGYVSDSELTRAAEDNNLDGSFYPQIDPQMRGQQLPQQSPGMFNDLQGWQATRGTAMRSTTRPPRDNATRAAEPGITGTPQVLHLPTPYNLLSLRDLYVQLPDQLGQLKRFGSDVFLHRDATSLAQAAPNGQQMPLDVPAGPNYVVGPGDTLSIALWGGIAQNLARTVDREGRIALPESGSVAVAGLTLERVQGVIAESLKQQYRNVQVAVTIARLRSIRVYVVGDVQRPGAYDISSLSTSLNALYAAGGPTGIGSLRLLRHYRGKQLVGDIDLYDFLLHGLQIEDRLQAGDTLLVPPAGPQIAVYGAVKRPAIYELKGSATLASVMEDAGGATAAAELGQIVVDRIDANGQRKTISLDLPALSTSESSTSGLSNSQSTRAAIAAFSVLDGDRIHVGASRRGARFFERCRRRRRPQSAGQTAKKPGAGSPQRRRGREQHRHHHGVGNSKHRRQHRGRTLHFQASLR
jgi:protein involved in polysaccharide export with SLBB domain